jgi:hypothetical protein
MEPYINWLVGLSPGESFANMGDLMEPPVSDPRQGANGSEVAAEQQGLSQSYQIFYRPFQSTLLVRQKEAEPMATLHRTKLSPQAMGSCVLERRSHC